MFREIRSQVATAAAVLLVLGVGAEAVVAINLSASQARERPRPSYVVEGLQVARTVAPVAPVSPVGGLNPGTAESDALIFTTPAAVGPAIPTVTAAAPAVADDELPMEMPVSFTDDSATPADGTVVTVGPTLP